MKQLPSCTGNLQLQSGGLVHLLSARAALLLANQLAHSFMLPSACCRMSRSFGAYNKKGYCGSGSCHQFAIVIGEFNLNLGEAVSAASVAFHFECHIVHRVAVPSWLRGQQPCAQGQW